MTSMRKTPSTRRHGALLPTTQCGASSAASAATAAAWAARAACTPRHRPSPMPRSPSTCEPTQGFPTPRGCCAGGFTPLSISFSMQEPSGALWREPTLRERAADRQGLPPSHGTVGSRGQILLVTVGVGCWEPPWGCAVGQGSLLLCRICLQIAAPHLTNPVPHQPMRATGRGHQPRAWRRPK